MWSASVYDQVAGVGACDGVLGELAQLGKVFLGMIVTWRTAGGSISRRIWLLVEIGFADLGNPEALVRTISTRSFGRDRASPRARVWRDPESRAERGRGVRRRAASPG
jgi:hypothetical protein